MPHRTQSWSYERANTFETGPTPSGYWQYNNPWDEQTRQDLGQTTGMPNNACLQPQSYYPQPPLDLQGPYAVSFAHGDLAPPVADASVKRPPASTTDPSAGVSSVMTSSKRPRLSEVNNNVQVWQPQRRNTFSEAQNVPFVDPINHDSTPELEQSFHLPTGGSCSSEASNCMNGTCTHTNPALGQDSSASAHCFDFTFRAQQLNSQHDHRLKVEPGTSVHASPEPGQNSRAPATLHSQSDSKDSSPMPELKEADRKRAHSAVERKYRGNLNNKIESLRVVLSSTHIAHQHDSLPPTSSNSGPRGPLLPPGSKKADVLANAIYYVQEAEASRAALLQEIAYLKEHTLNLEKRVRCDDDCAVLKQLACMKVDAMGKPV